jgi:hypothetical protein
MSMIIKAARVGFGLFISRFLTRPTEFTIFGGTANPALARLIDGRQVGAAGREDEVKSDIHGDANLIPVMVTAHARTYQAMRARKGRGNSAGRALSSRKPRNMDTSKIYAARA